MINMMNYEITTNKTKLQVSLAKYYETKVFEADVKGQDKGMVAMATLKVFPVRFPLASNRISL